MRPPKPQPAKPPSPPYLMLTLVCLCMTPHSHTFPSSSPVYTEFAMGSRAVMPALMFPPSSLIMSTWLSLFTSCKCQAPSESVVSAHTFTTPCEWPVNNSSRSTHSLAAPL